MRTIASALLALACATGTALAQSSGQTPYLARTYNPANPGLARSAGAPAVVANQDYVKALARIVYYWAYPAIDVTNIPWQIAVGSDLQHECVQGKRTAQVRFVNWYIARLFQSANRDPVLATKLLEVANLMKAPSTLLRPAVALRVWKSSLLA